MKRTITCIIIASLVRGLGAAMSHTPPDKGPITKEVVTCTTEQVVQGSCNVITEAE